MEDDAVHGGSDLVTSGPPSMVKQERFEDVNAPPGDTSLIFQGPGLTRHPPPVPCAGGVGHLRPCRASTSRTSHTTVWNRWRSITRPREVCFCWPRKLLGLRWIQGMDGGLADGPDVLERRSKGVGGVQHGMRRGPLARWF